MTRTQSRLLSFVPYLCDEDLVDVCADDGCHEKVVAAARKEWSRRRSLRRMSPWQ